MNVIVVYHIFEFFYILFRVLLGYDDLAVDILQLRFCIK